MDVSPEEARVLHRVVRSIHDGNCPACGEVMAAVKVATFFGWKCPACRWGLTHAEARAAMDAFRPAMRQNLATFEAWRTKFRASVGMPPFDLEAEQKRDAEAAAVWHSRRAELGKAKVPPAEKPEPPVSVFSTAQRLERLRVLSKVQLMDMAEEAHRMLDALQVPADVAGYPCDDTQCWHILTHRIHLLGKDRDALAQALQKLVGCVDASSARMYVGPDTMDAIRAELERIFGVDDGVH